MSYTWKFVKRVDLMLSALTTKKAKGHKETFGGNECGYYLNWGDGNTSVWCILPNLSNCTCWLYTLFQYASDNKAGGKNFCKK